MKTIITTVGTSLFENYNREEVSKALGNKYEPIFQEYKELRDNRSSASDYDYDGSEEEKIIRVIKDKWFQGVTKVNQEWTLQEGVLNEYASAEIESILKICDAHKNEDIEVILIATDTVLSVLASNLIKDFFELIVVQNSLPHIYSKVKFELILTNSNNSIDYEKSYIIKNLRINKDVNDLEDLFKQGTKNFIKKLLGWENSKPSGIISTAINNNNDVIFNITGGYKSAVVISTLISQMESQYIPLKFLHENSSQIATIPALPVGLDWGIMELLHPFLDEKLLEDKSHYKNYGFDQYIEDLTKWNLIEKTETDDNMYQLSVIGTLVRDYLKRITDLTPYTNQTLGIFHEYKVQEFYLENYGKTIDEGKITSIAIRGKKMSKAQGDYDIVFEKEVLVDNSKVTEVVACELKALKKLDDIISKKQLTKYYNNFPHDFPDKNLTEIRLIMTILPGQENLSSDVKDKLQKLKKEISNLPTPVRFSVYTLQVKIKRDNQKIDYFGYLNGSVTSQIYKPYTDF